MKSTPASRWRELAHEQLRGQYPDFDLIRYDNEVKRILTVLQVIRYPSVDNLDFLIGRLRYFGYGRDDIKRIVHKHNRWPEYDTDDFAKCVDGHRCNTLDADAQGDDPELVDLEAVADKSFRLSLDPSITVQARREHLQSFTKIAGRLP